MFLSETQTTNLFSHVETYLRRKLASLHFNQCNKSPNYLMMNIWTINRQHGFQDFENVSLSWDKFSWHSKLYVPRCCPDPFHLTFPSIASTTNEHLDSSKGPPTHIIYNEWMLSKLSTSFNELLFSEIKWIAFWVTERNQNCTIEFQIADRVSIVNNFGNEWARGNWKIAAILST